MPVQLWHSTDPPNDRAILANGFDETRGNLLYLLMKGNDSWLFPEKVMLEVSLDVELEDLAPYTEKVEWRDRDGRFTGELEYRFRIPAVYLNAHATKIEIIRHEEGRRIAGRVVE